MSLHKIFGWLIVHNRRFGRWVEGDKITLFENGRFIENNLNKGLVCREDIMQGVRKSTLAEDMTLVERVYMERNGEISTIKNNSNISK